MNIRDPQVLRHISPATVSHYLEQNGWQQVQQLDGKATVWVNEEVEAGEVDILLPIDPDLQDFSLRMGDVLQTLSVVEKVSPQEIFERLVDHPKDQIAKSKKYHFVEKIEAPRRGILKNRNDLAR